MNPLDPLLAQQVNSVLNAPGDFVRALHFVVLDVDHPDPQGDTLAQVGEDLQLIIAAAGELQHQVVHVQVVEEAEQAGPEAALDALAAVVAEAEMQRAFTARAVEHMVDRLIRPGGVLRVAGQIGLVDLEDGRVNGLDLAAQHFSDGHGQAGQVTVVSVQQRLRQHVGRGHGELERDRCQLLHHLPAGGQVQFAFADGAFDHAGRLRAEAHALLGAKIGYILTAHFARDAGHRPHEIFDHPVRLGVVDVKAGQLAVGDHVQPGQLLRLEDDENGVAQVGDGRIGGQPGWQRIAADDGCLDGGCGHWALLVRDV